MAGPPGPGRPSIPPAGLRPKIHIHLAHHTNNNNNNKTTTLQHYNTNTNTNAAIQNMFRHHKNKPKKPPTNLRGIFAGCGTLLNRNDMGPHVLSLTGKSNPSDVTLVYLGTPSYDIVEKRVAQTSWYVDVGCRVISLDVVLDAPPTCEMAEMIDKADVILVSGGNTSYAMRRWERIGLTKLIREACLGSRRVVMAGGSAGAICWWSGGHSDSMDPDSYKEAKLGSSHPDIDDDDAAAAAHSGGGDDDVDDDEDDEKKRREVEEDEDAKEWDYIRVDGLGFVPGLCCPHHDRVQSNGVLRATDFDTMMLRHPREVGICIDHNAAFVIDRSSYRVLRPEDEELPGSVADDGSFSGDRLGRPGVWIKEVLGDGVTMRQWQCPETGRICDLLRVPEEIVPSVRHMNLAANLNPDDGPMRMSYPAYPGFATKSYFGGNLEKDYMEALAEVSDEAEESDAIDDDGTKRGWIQKEKEKIAAGIQKEKEKVAAGIRKEKEKVAAALEKFHPHAKK